MKELDQFTVERLEEIGNSFLDQIQEKAPSIEEVFALIDIALSAKQAEPVAYMTYKGYLIHAGDPKLLEYSDPQPLYDTPPANSPVVPEGWKLVPIVPTEKMVIDGFESEPDKSFSNDDVWEEYQAMSGCRQAAHRAKLCWDAMLAAAPEKENG
ncbi:hypothetical protein [Yersinia ruckeri]|uniref:hypothetical protein n=1 Tax=Yersinia ruckeri TaxID=29486 RepID=UPI0008FE97E1|nr:hypothetical protein [Yersinia ruckeri]OJB95776.1 hypothetical protein AXW59_07485 [Yersinia ruckeri]OJB98577.1 hypothetical protein AXW58_07465 [Yersinia ruckeri]OJC00225.1 hypothetical protein AXW57_07480 [Yersinia ruckeri]